jgi:hypothetical protein
MDSSLDGRATGRSKPSTRAPSPRIGPVATSRTASMPSARITALARP